MRSWVCGDGLLVAGEGKSVIDRQRIWLAVSRVILAVRLREATGISYANSKGLRQKLNRQKLELSVDKLPNAFAWKSVDHIIFLVLYYIHWEQIFFQPQKQDITVTYRLLKDNEETKKGTIIIKDINQKLYLKFFQFSGKKFIGRYLDQHNTNIQTMSKELVDKLIIEL